MAMNGQKQSEVDPMAFLLIEEKDTKNCYYVLVNNNIISLFTCQKPLATPKRKVEMDTMAWWRYSIESIYWTMSDRGTKIKSSEMSHVNSKANINHRISMVCCP